MFYCISAVMTAERLCEEMTEDKAEEYNEEAEQTLNSEKSKLSYLKLPYFSEKNPPFFP